MSGDDVGWVRRAAFALWHREVSTSDTESPIEYGGYLFTAPVPLFKAPVPAKGGLFVIQVRNWTWPPRGFQPIHFGESDNLYQHLFVDGDSNYVHWLSHRHAGDGLFVSVMPTPNWLKPAREIAENGLVRKYWPGRQRSVDEYLRDTGHRTALQVTGASDTL